MLGVVVNIVDPGNAFVYITAVATVGILWVWGMIAFCHLRFRRAGHTAAESRFPLPGHPWSNFAVIGYCALVLVLLAITPDQRVAVIAGAVWSALLAFGWWRISRRRRAQGPAERP
jgi:L-asparagine transporter-like permease